MTREQRAAAREIAALGLLIGMTDAPEAIRCALLKARILDLGAWNDPAVRDECVRIRKAWRTRRGARGLNLARVATWARCELAGASE